MKKRLEIMFSFVPFTIMGEMEIGCGLISRSSKMYQFIDKFRAKDDYFGDRTTIDKFDNVTLVNKLQTYLGDSLFFVKESKTYVESSKLEAPTEHRVSNFHQDSDEYDNGFTMLFYPRVDSTIEDGRLRIALGIDINMCKEYSEKVNSELGRDLLSCELIWDDMNNIFESQLVFNNKCDEDSEMIPFIIFGSHVLHKVEPINGTGIRECIFLSLNAHSLWKPYPYENDDDFY